MLCPESLRAQAYFDGELDAVRAAEIERHLERCPECRELQQGLERTRAALRRDLSYFRVAPELAARIDRALDQHSRGERAGWRPRPFWAGALSGVGLAAAAAAFAFFFLLPARTGALIDDLMGAHMRSLMSTHLIDVVSSDRHTVKPWFAGHADVSPAVADFEPQGYRLVGGRAEYLDHQRSAVLVYQHGPHIINVFTWAAERRATPRDVTDHGYHLLFWRSADLEYCAVSDTGWDELRVLARLIQGLNVRDDAP